MTAAHGDVLLLGRTEVEGLLDLQACIDVVEGAFRRLGEGHVLPPRSLGIQVENGAFHVKAGVLDLERCYFAAKVNGNFPGNPARNGRPTIQGLIVLADAANGRPLAVMDSIAITTLRTGAASAVAARHLARRESRVATVIGCGVQGRMQLAALRAVLPIERVFAIDRDRCAADRLADECGASGLDARVANDLATAVAESDVVITCTPSREPLLRAGSLRPGTFVAAVGADNPDKHEIEPRLMRSCLVVVDDLDQCASYGDLHHAIDAGVMALEDVHARLGEVVAGRRSGRTGDDQIIVFDSTGIAIQDVAAAALVYERAVARRAGTALALAG